MQLVWTEEGEREEITGGLSATSLANPVLTPYLTPESLINNRINLDNHYLSLIIYPSNS